MQRTMVEFGAHTDEGIRHEVNEDSLAGPAADLAPQALAQKGYLCVVADGSGEHAVGKAASDLAVHVVMQEYYADTTEDVEDSLRRALRMANAEVYRQSQNPPYAGMGASLVAAVVQEDSLTVAHVGNCRAYLVRGDTMETLTTDHTWVAEQVRDGQLTPQKAQQHERRRELTRLLGREAQLAVDVSQRTLHPGDRLLLCSDGLWEYVDETAMRRVLSAQPAQAAAEQLVALANVAGGPDNITAAVLRPRPSIAPTFVSESRARGVLAGPLERTRELLAGPLEQARGLLAGPLDRSKELLAGPLGRFSALPAQGRRLVLTLGAALLVASLACLAVLLIRRPLPSMPAVEVAPVRYMVQEGDTPDAIASHFRVPASTLAAELAPGQPIQLVPGEHAILFSGQVVRLDRQTDVVTLQVRNRQQQYDVRVDQWAGDGTIINGDVRAEKGDTVAVIGYLTGDGAVEAMVVDVWQGAIWRTWYLREIDADVWVYSAFSGLVAPADVEESGSAGGQMLALAGWSRSPMGMALEWDEQDLYRLGADGLYASSLGPANRQSLTWRFGPTETPATQPSDEPVEVTATPEATMAPDVPEARFGQVNDPVGLRVRSGPTTQASELDLLPDGQQVRIACVTTGEYIQDVDSDRWYRIGYGETGQGYVAALYVDLQDITMDDIPECE
jgi:protein phosphatase